MYHDRQEKVGCSRARVWCDWAVLMHAAQVLATARSRTTAQVASAEMSAALEVRVWHRRPAVGPAAEACGTADDTNGRRRGLLRRRHARLPHCGPLLPAVPGDRSGRQGRHPAGPRLPQPRCVHAGRYVDGTRRAHAPRHTELAHKSMGEVEGSAAVGFLEKHLQVRAGVRPLAAVAQSVSRRAACARGRGPGRPLAGHGSPR
jgi:hypothetical protein